MSIRPFLSLAILAIGSTLLSSCGVEQKASSEWWGNDFIAIRKPDPRPDTRKPRLSPEEQDLRERRAAIAERERKREAKRQATLAARRGVTVAPAPAAPAPAPSSWFGRSTPTMTEQVSIATPGEVPGAAPKKRGGFFSGFAKPRKEEHDGHAIFVNHELLETMQPANARIEISLGEQRARLYQKHGRTMHLVVDTAISTGKPGHETPTGTYKIGEKSVEKKSSIYGTWLDASGTPVPSSGEVTARPSGASTFVGADMPYWMRVTGGIGMHIGEVPGYPASHGCIRVPEAIQPLIFSKVQVGTPVTILR